MFPRRCAVMWRCRLAWLPRAKLTRTPSLRIPCSSSGRSFCSLWQRSHAWTRCLKLASLLWHPQVKTFHSIPFHSIPFHSIPFHSIPFHSHLISFQFILFHLISSHVVSCSFHVIQWFIKYSSSPWVRYVQSWAAPCVRSCSGSHCTNNSMCSRSGEDVCMFVNIHVKVTAQHCKLLQSCCDDLHECRCWQMKTMMYSCSHVKELKCAATCHCDCVSIMACASAL